MNGFELDLFLLLSGVSLIGAVGVIPMSAHFIRLKLTDITVPPERAAVASAMQGGILAIGAAGGGLVFAHWAGFELPVFRALTSDLPFPGNAPGQIRIGLLLGLVSGIIVLGLEWLVFWNHLPAGLKQGLEVPTWKRLAATLYGGVTEEVLTRLFFLSLFAWALSFIWSNSEEHASGPAIWIAVLLSALVFGLLHLPATILLAPLTRVVVIRTLILNGVVGVVAGWMFVEYGLAVAMATHWAADIMVLIVAPVVQKRLIESGRLTEASPGAER